MQKSHSILVVDDDDDVLTSARLMLKPHFAAVKTTNQPADLNHLLTKQPADLVLLDMNFRKGKNDGQEGLYWLKHILKVSPTTEVVLMTAYGEVELAVEAMKEGAFDFVLKPWTNEKLLATLNGALRLAREKKKVQQLEDTKTNLEEKLGLQDEDLVTRSPVMQQVMETLQKVAVTDANILLLGENGTGKSALALTLHRMSLRAKNPFVTVDLGAVAASLFESELFGHKKGAFTDAHENRPGRFETAHQGSLFLDEIGNLDLSLQSKLLRVLQSQKLSRVGENIERSVNVRLISASNSPLHQMASEQQFRQDLLYRINTVEIEVPPLRNRREDIPYLAKRLFEKFSRKYHKSHLYLSLHAIDALCEYHWPGNIRELGHAIERAIILASGPEIKAQDLQLKHNGTNQPSGLNLEQMERHLVQKALAKNVGNISKAARDLGLTRAALYRRIEKHDL